MQLIVFAWGCNSLDSCAAGLVGTENRISPTEAV